MDLRPCLGPIIGGGDYFLLARTIVAINDPTPGIYMYVFIYIFYGMGPLLRAGINIKYIVKHSHRNHLLGRSSVDLS